jgi:hypothetical protein
MCRNETTHFLITHRSKSLKENDTSNNTHTMNLNKMFFQDNIKSCQVLAAHTYNPSYLGD